MATETPKAEPMEKPAPYETLSDEAIRELALGMESGTIFTDRQLRDPKEIGMVFPVLVLAGPNLMEWVDENRIMLVYESIDKAGPRSVNGYPIFFSCKFLDETDLMRVIGELEKLEKWRAGDADSE